MTKRVEVSNLENKHKNAIAELVQKACKYESHIELVGNGKNINGKSLMGMMAFGLHDGMKVDVCAEGTDAEQAVADICEFLAS
ncbi:MAG: HPr family phosphocarrier protein [Lachnospiraceae bacterium]|jgi:phosphocarrier protein|nr:HPr family phosphocarrier protein [Lachnospiraceae bacterium]MCH4030357.1 HPr family phosphocarrier protein [Lachnospiraceae bacterium]MCH4069569.1 HPr family phosphocarrier protein [Lachnospiraceae bacterium]MCH4107495.1 HPr family phosphocarrier protein [Lachnospiraceae bacterium]MCI1301654.1 HPr family phosphocarrier protein [Lachnospiraceae bacterium]